MKKDLQTAQLQIMNFVTQLCGANLPFSGVNIQHAPRIRNDIAGQKILVTPHGSKCPSLFELLTGGANVVNSDAMKIAQTLVRLSRTREEIDKEYEANIDLFRGLSELTANEVIIALCEDDVYPSNPYTAFAKTIGHSYKRKWESITRIPRLFNDPPAESFTNTTIVKNMMFDETSRQNVLKTIGRKNALKCCPVFARKMIREPHEHKGELDRTLNDTNLTLKEHYFREGVYTPTVHLAPGFKWRDDMLYMQSTLPQTIKMAAEGAKLSNIITHPDIPTDINILKITKRISSGDTVIKTDAKSVPMGPLLDQIGINLTE